MGEFAPGTVFAGHRIEAVAGRGGMGVVYRARQLSLDRVVALKVIAPALMQDAAIRRRFVRESRVAASIDHPNVIPIYYTGEEEGVAYIAMRHVAGDDLRTLVRRTGGLEPRRAAHIVSQVAAALDAAHAAGLVHRDVKPANVLLGQGDHAYLTDFGLTKHVLSEAGATRPGHWVGTLDFVAPEQIRGERVDARADVYGLGCLLHYALSGKPVFQYDTDEAKLWAHLSEPPPRISESVPAAPEAFDAVIERALAKAAGDRFPSAGDLGRAALAAAAGQAVAETERMVAVGAAAPTEAETLTAATVRRAPAATAGPQEQPTARQEPDEPTVRDAPARPRSRARRLAPIAAALALFAAGAAGAVLVAGDDEPPTATPTPTPTTSAPAAPTVTDVRLGGRLNAVAVGGGHVWTGGFANPRLIAVDPEKTERIRRLRPEIGVGLSAMAADGDSLWALLSRERRLVQLDARTGEIEGEPIPMPGAANALVAGAGAVWVAVTTPELDPGDQIVRIDPEDGQITRTLEVADGIRRLVIADGGLWLLASNPARLIRIDLKTGKRRRTALDADTAGDLAWGGGAIWVTLADTDTLLRVDPESWNGTEIAVGRSPAGVAVHRGSVWVANRTESTLTRVDLRTRRVTGQLQVPLNPYELDAAGEHVWVTSLATGRLARVSVAAR